MCGWKKRMGEDSRRMCVCAHALNTLNRERNICVCIPLHTIIQAQHPFFVSIIKNSICLYSTTFKSPKFIPYQTCAHIVRIRYQISELHNMNACYLGKKSELHKTDESVQYTCSKVASIHMQLEQCPGWLSAKSQSQLATRLKWDEDKSNWLWRCSATFALKASSIYVPRKLVSLFTVMGCCSFSNRWMKILSNSHFTPHPRLRTSMGWENFRYYSPQKRKLTAPRRRSVLLWRAEMQGYNIFLHVFLQDAWICRRVRCKPTCL